MKQVVLATGNPGKVKELSDMLSPLNIKVMPQSDFNVPDIAETGTTFVENAIIKARHAAKLTGSPAIADDSGLEVSSLKSAPGIYSARYAKDGASDKENINKLLADLAGIDQRQARFCCVLVYIRHEFDPTPIICQGFWQGSIMMEPSGENGFGYDPIFYVPEKNVSSAQLDKHTKNSLSHRGKALKQLLTLLTEDLK